MLLRQVITLNADSIEVKIEIINKNDEYDEYGKILYGCR